MKNKGIIKESLEKIILVSALGISSIAGTGCGFNMPGPGGRIGCTPVKTALTSYIGQDASRQERGIAYTCKAGHIDMAHTRKYAEWSQEYAKIVLKNLENGHTQFSFKGTEPARYDVKISYPKNWSSLNEESKKEIINNIAIELGPYFAFQTSIMHETLTWFGWKSTFIVPEFSSAFSWEDRFSDTFGCYLAGLAMRNKEHNFPDAIDILLNKEFERLGVQSKDTCINAVKSVEGKWYSQTGLDGKMMMRNFDIGERDNQVNPCMIPVKECFGAEPWAVPIPQLRYAQEQGFNVEIEIEPFAKKEVFKKILGKETINPKEDYSRIMQEIKKEAKEKGYDYVD
jgi:hypothetical protein